MSHEMGIEDNQDTLISEMHKGVKRGESPFCKIWREKRSGRCILLQLYGEIHNKGKRDTLSGKLKAF